MRLRAQLLLSALGTALFCAIVAVVLLGERAADSTNRLLDEQVRLGEQALIRQWALRRAERTRAFSSIASQPALREALTTANRSALSGFAQQARAVGAEAVSLVNRQGGSLWQDGTGGNLLPELALRSHVPETGALFALGGQIYDVFRLPIGTDAPMGYLIATHRVEASQLHADLDPFGVAAAVAVEGSLLTSLPNGLLTTPRWGEDPRYGLPELATRYHLRISNFDNGRLLLAAPVTKVRAFTGDFLRQIAGLLVLIVAGAVAVALVVLSRITGPIEDLQHAADTLGQGHLTRSRAMMKPLAYRRDEIGALARAFMAAAQRLNAVVNASQRLVRDIDTTVLVVERSAATVAQGAMQQEERLKEMLSNLGPLTAGLEQTSQGLADARNLVVQLALHSSNADQAQAVLFTVARRVEAIVSASSPEGQDARTYRTATVLQQVSALLSSVNDQRDALARIREQTQVLRTRLDGALESQVREQHHGQFAQRAGGEIGRVARLHVQESEALRISAEQLRSDIEELQGLLYTLDTRNEDGRISGVAGVINPATAERQRLVLPNTRAASSESLGGRERSASGSGSRRPVRPGSSSPGNRPVTGSAAAIAGATSSAAKALSTGRSSGTNKPVPSAVSAREPMPSPSAVSARGLRSPPGSPFGIGSVSSGQNRPVPPPSAVSGRGIKPSPSALSAGDASLSGSAAPSAVSARNSRSAPPGAMSSVSSGGLVPAVKPSALSGGGQRPGVSSSGLRAPVSSRISGQQPALDAPQLSGPDLPPRRR